MTVVESGRILKVLDRKPQRLCEIGPNGQLLTNLRLQINRSENITSEHEGDSDRQSWAKYMTLLRLIPGDRDPASLARMLLVYKV